MNELTDKLLKQARMYESIDAGTGFGWDKDAQNIRDAVKVIQAYRNAISEIKAFLVSWPDNDMRYDDMRRADIPKRVASSILRIIMEMEEQSLNIDKLLEKPEIIEAEGCA